MKKKVVKTPHDLNTERQMQEEKDKTASIKREMLFLTRKVGSNALSAGYYVQMKDLLEDLLMLELAQRAAEATIQFNTKNKIISIEHHHLNAFRAEMEKAKTLKLITGILSLSGHFDVEGVLDKVTTAMYGPKTKKEKTPDLLAELKKIMADYAKKITKVKGAAE